jgi:DNA invertase Pin-like site-specific DNA recombinase
MPPVDSKALLQNETTGTCDLQNWLFAAVLESGFVKKPIFATEPVVLMQELLQRTTMKIGYARVSTKDQHLDLQLRALKKAGCQKIFREKLSGYTRQRPEFQRMLDQIRFSDTIVVWKLDRLARSTRDLLNTMEAISEAGGKFQSLSEPWANTTTHAGKMIMTVFAGIAEFERDLIRERTGAGREAARQRGVRFGRPRKLNLEQVQLASQLLAQGRRVPDIAKTFDVHEATIYRVAATL